MLRRNSYLSGIIGGVIAGAALAAVSLPAFADSGTGVNIVPVPPKDNTNAQLSEHRLPMTRTQILPPRHRQPAPGAVRAVPPVVVTSPIAPYRAPGPHPVRVARSWGPTGASRHTHRYVATAARSRSRAAHRFYRHHRTRTHRMRRSR